MSCRLPLFSHLKMHGFEVCPNIVPYNFSTPEHIVNMIHRYYSKGLVNLLTWLLTVSY